jgi:hexulose-6-phosphate isomerase
MNRREFVSTSAASLAAAQTGGGRLPMRKGIYWSMLPSKLSVEERFMLAKECGFQSVECPTMDEASQVEEVLAASRKTGLPVHSVMNRDHWKFPLSSPDPSVVEKCVHGIETSIRNAKAWGAETVLLVPAVVNAEVGYKQAWDRSTAQIRKLLPLARENKVVIGVEEVWNKFLLSPLEFARYVDEFNSPWVKAYFDVGNCVLWGYPQDWIRTLGNRIVKLHFKDFKFQMNSATRKREAEFVNLGDGEIDWKAVHAALAETGFRGTATVELPGGDRDYLVDMSRRVDKILAGA